MNKTPAPIPKGRIAVSVHYYLTISEDSRLRSRSSIQRRSLAAWPSSPQGSPQCGTDYCASKPEETSAASTRPVRITYPHLGPRSAILTLRPRLLPLGEYRILQAQEAAGNPATPTMSRQSHGPIASHPDRSAPATNPQSESNVGPESSQVRGDSAVPDAPQTKSGASADSNSGPRPGPEPTPQRTRDDGRVYTKAM